MRQIVQASFRSSERRKDLALGQFYKYRTPDGVQAHTKPEILSRVTQRAIPGLNPVGAACL